MKIISIKMTLMTVAAFTVAGCGSMADMNRSSHSYSNSLYPFLGSNQSITNCSQAVPQPSLPLRVGIAFVPGQSQTKLHGTSKEEDECLSASDKMSLTQPIASQFEESPMVKSVEIIPSSYLSSEGGSESLNRIQSIFGVNTLVLVSYDQTQFSDEGAVALTYWSVVGAYFVQGERNTTKTLVDVAVYDIASRRQLFHVTGNDETQGSATPVNLSEELRDESKRSFGQAVMSLTSKLKARLEQFQPQPAT